MKKITKSETIAYDNNEDTLSIKHILHNNIEHKVYASSIIVRCKHRTYYNDIFYYNDERYGTYIECLRQITK